MQKRIKALLKDNIFIIAICITIAIAYLSLMKIPKLTPNVSGIDKWEHAFAYFTLTICWLFTFYKKPKIKYYVVAACIIYGIIIEVLQSTITTYRTGEALDILANSTGVLLALLFFNQFLKKNRVNLQ